MRSRTPLALMEQVIMVLVFALSAALCLQVFIFADQLSAQNRDTDRAVLLAQNTAELVKACGGILPAAESAGGEVRQAVWHTYYGDDLTPVSAQEHAVFEVVTCPEHSGTGGLGKATVSVLRSDGQKVLFSLPVCWQEVTDDG